MLHQNTAFHGLLKYLPWHLFEEAVEKYGADDLSRELSTKRHLIALLFGQLSGASSLREIVTGMASHETRLYHLGGGAGEALDAFGRQRPAAMASVRRCVRGAAGASASRAAAGNGGCGAAD